MKVDIQTLENKMTEIKGEVSAEVFEGYREGALARLGAEIEIDGFRKGKAPANVVEKKVGEDAVLREMAEMAIAEHYPKILDENKIDAIGQPLVSLTKLAKGNPLGFSIKTATMPELTLPDYKAIAKKESAKEDISVTDKEVEDSLLQVRQMRAHQKMHEDGVEHDDHDPKNIKEEDLPELTDEAAKTFGPFETVDALKKAVRENLEQDKENKLREKNRIAILEKVIDETKGDIPDMLIEIETENMFARLKNDLQQFGSNFEDYLKNIGKSEADLRAEWRKEAERRAKLQLVIEEIAKKEEITADKEAVDAEVKKVSEAYPETNEIRARQYIEVTMRNEEVFKFLEKQA
jgi:FKBP-type peptidyl-prolyl cis-trans isomerase (trigger factor)